MISRLPLRRLIPMALVAFIIPPMILLSYWHYRVEREALLERYQQQAVIAMGGFHRFVENGLAIGQQETLDQAVASLADYPCFSRAIGTDDKMTIFLASQEGWVGQPLQDIDPLLAATWPDNRHTLVRYEEHELRVSAFQHINLDTQNVDDEMMRTGWLYLEFDLNRVLLEQLQSTTKQAVTASIIVLLFSLLLWWWLARNFTRPLSELTDAVKALANDESREAIQEQGSLEFSHLARAFNEMKHELNHRYSALMRQRMLYQALSETNQTILHNHDEEALLQGVCRAAVQAGIKLAWIGYLDRHTNSLRVEYIAGDDTDWLGSVRRHIGLEKDPLVMSLKQGEEKVINLDMDNLDNTHWLAEAKLNGFTAGAALPVIRGGTNYGGLVVMLDDEALLDEDGMQLLREMAADLSYALDTIDRESMRRRVEQRLTGDRALLRTLIDTVPDMIFIKDSIQTYLGCNQAFEKLVAMPEEKVVGGMEQDVFPDYLAKEFYEQDRQILQSGVARRSEEWMEYPDGRRVLLDIVKTPYRGADGKVMGLIGVGRDITAEFHARKSQQRTLELLQNAEHLSNLGSWAFAPKTGQMHLSDMIYTILDFPRDGPQPEFMDFIDRCYPEDRQQMQQNGKALKAGEIDEFLQEHRIVLPNGEIRHLITRGRVNKDSDQKFSVMGTIQDITAQKVAEEERNRAWEAMRQAQKLETIGGLTGGVVRDLNNVFVPILGFSEIARRSDNLSQEKLQVYLQRISESAVRGRDLIIRLISISRGESVEQASAQDLPLLVEEAVKLLRATLPPGIRLSVEYEHNLPKVVIDPVHLDLMVVNLCVNARDALGENGEIQISLKIARDLNVHCAACGAVIQGDCVELCVADNGEGIPKDQIGKLFDPFYTTKTTEEKRSGMGLAVLQGLLQSYGSHVLVESDSGQGARFRLLLKQGVEKEKIPSELPPANISQQPFNSQRVLLVDDEPAVTLFMQEYLELKGLNVDAFTDSEKALHHFLLTPDKVDLLITDQAMTAMTGIQLIERVREVRPDLPVMLCTGYSEEINNDNAEEYGIDFFLDKPVAPDGLLSALYICLCKLDPLRVSGESQS